MPFVKSKPPLTTRSLRSLRAAAPSTSSPLCLHHGHPFVAASEKNTFFYCREAKVVSKIFYNTVIVLSVVL